MVALALGLVFIHVGVGQVEQGLECATGVFVGNREAVGETDADAVLVTVVVKRVDVLLESFDECLNFGA